MFNPSGIFGYSGICTLHSKTLQYICLTDKEKLCADCAIIGKHRDSKNHNLKPLDYLNESIGPSKKIFEDLSSKMDSFVKNTEKLNEEQKKATLSIVQIRFRELQFMLNAKEIEFTNEINSFYERKIEAVRSQIGTNSLAKRIVSEKISTYQNITRNPRPFDLLEEDTSAILRIIRDAVAYESFNKIDEMFQQMKLEIDSTLRGQLSALEDIQIEKEKWKNASLKLDEELTAKLAREKRPSILQPMPLFSNSAKNDIVIEGNKLLISYPFEIDVNKNLGVMKNDVENVLFLQFKVTKNFQEMSRDDMSKLCFIRSKFINIKYIEIMIIDFEVSDGALLDLFSCLFWKNEVLERILLSYNMKGLFDKSLLFLAENVLPSALNLKKFTIVFLECEATEKAYDALNESLSLLAHTLVTLSYCINCKSAKSSSFEKLFHKGMPNLKFFALRFNSDAFNNQALEAFVSNFLPSLKQLEEFQLFIYNSGVTDLCVKRLFSNFPKEWFLKLKQFRLGLNGTKISDESLREFLVYETLSKFQRLDKFTIYADETQVTSLMKGKISQWEQNFAEKSPTRLNTTIA